MTGLALHIAEPTYVERAGWAALLAVARHVTANASFVGGVVGGLLLSAPHKLGFALLIGSAVWIAFAVGLPRLAPSPRSKRPGR